MNKDNLLGFACICENIRTLGRILSLKSLLVIKKWKRKEPREGRRKESFPFFFYSELLGLGKQVERREEKLKSLDCSGGGRKEEVP